MLFPAAIPDIINNSNIKYDDSSWILFGYLITSTVMAPIPVKLYDIYEKKKVLIILMAIFIARIAMAAECSTNISVLIASKKIRGIIWSYEVIIFISD